MIAPQRTTGNRQYTSPVGCCYLVYVGRGLRYRSRGSVVSSTNFLTLCVPTGQYAMFFIRKHGRHNIVYSAAAPAKAYVNYGLGCMCFDNSCGRCCPWHGASHVKEAPTFGRHEAVTNRAEHVITYFDVYHLCGIPPDDASPPTRTPHSQRLYESQPKRKNDDKAPFTPCGSCQIWRRSEIGAKFR